MGKIIRVTNWQSILAKELLWAKKQTFEYGVYDCVTWTAKVIRSYTNLDWTPSWTTEKEAMKLHRKVRMEDKVSELLGPPRGNILLTKRGDVVQKELGIKSSLGICIGSKVAFVYDKGLCYADLTDCIYSWRV